MVKNTRHHCSVLFSDTCGHVKVALTVAGSIFFLDQLLGDLAGLELLVHPELLGQLSAAGLGWDLAVAAMKKDLINNLIHVHTDVLMHLTM